MRHLSGSERPHYVSDRLSAISNVPMQFLVSAGVVMTILTAASLADFAKKSEEAGFVDAQQTASILRATDRNVTAAGAGGVERGFTDLGRFSAYYRRLYGEPPR